MRIKNIAAASVTALAAIAAVLATGAPAQAATTKFCNISFEFAGNGCFYSTGDKFTVQDMRADGLRTVLEWRTTDGRSGECHDSNGANNPPTTCDYDLKENEVVVFYLENRNGATGAPSNMGQAITAWTSGR
ncbi:hypothetical protein ABZY19_39355 [Streptomyces sp. NPDC006475]|uniref:hypothetical protein n=1 Tax=unclassified Streptomyces TaxID=2593676 RepID=UPI002E281982|nr:hypothetical protein [Streptomyces sp. NBC_00306]